MPERGEGSRVIDQTTFKTILGEYSSQPRLGQLQSAVTALRQDASDTKYLELDLLELFAIMQEHNSAEALATHERALKKALDKAERQKASGPAKQLLQELVKQRKFSNPAFWQSIQQKAGEQKAQRLVTAVQDVAREATLGAVPVSLATRSLRGWGLDAAGVQEGIRQLRAEGVDVFDDLDIIAQVPTGVLSTWQSARSHAEYRGPVDVLMVGENPPKSVEAISRLAADGQPILLAHVAAARERVRSRKDTNANAAGAAVLSALHALPSDEALHQVVLGLVADGASAALGQGAPARRVVQDLVDTGLTEQDARRIVASALNSASKQPAEPDLAAVRQSLAAAQLDVAERLLQAVATTDKTEKDREELVSAIAVAREKKAAALTSFRSAMNAGRYDAAQEHILAAIRADADDATLRDLAACIPPGAPHVTAQVQGAVVSLSWGARPDLTYTVARLTAAGSGGPAQEVASSLDGGHWVDADAPVGAVEYGVTAVNASGVASSMSIVQVQLLPPVVGLHAVTGESHVDLSWRLDKPAHSFEVRVLGAHGVPAPQEVTALTARVSGLRAGEEYRFEVRARYLTASGLVSAPPAVTTANPRAAARPIDDLRLVEAGEKALVFTAVGGYPAQIWVSAQGVPLQRGELLSQEQLRAAGLRCVHVQSAGRADAEVRVPARDLPTLGRVYALVETTGGLLIGHSIAVADVPPVERVRVDEFADQLRLTWAWPPLLDDVDVTFERHGRPETVRVTQARYRAAGGLYLPRPHEVSNIRLVALVQRGGATYQSAAVAAPWAPRQVFEVACELKESKSFTGKRTVTVTLRVLAGVLGDTRFTVLLGEGAQLPTRHGSRAVGAFEVRFEPGATVSQTFDLGKVKPPYRLRVVADSDVPIAITTH